MELNFSKNGEGRIRITTVGTTLFLDEIKNNHLKIGDKVSMNDDYKQRVELNFYKMESVDILIEKLIAIKNNIIMYSAS